MQYTFRQLPHYKQDTCLAPMFEVAHQFFILCTVQYVLLLSGSKHTVSRSRRKEALSKFISGSTPAMPSTKFLEAHAINFLRHDVASAPMHK
jgi:hypothetical protein